LVPLEAEELPRICFESGADDVGFLSIDDPEIAAQKADIIKLFPDTRTVVSLLCRMNQEPVRSVVRSVPNQEFHETYDTVNATARHQSPACALCFSDWSNVIFCCLGAVGLSAPVTN
jgi:hypothetical protein